MFIVKASWNSPYIHSTDIVPQCARTNCVYAISIQVYSHTWISSNTRSTWAYVHLIPREHEFSIHKTRPSQRAVYKVFIPFHSPPTTRLQLFSNIQSCHLFLSDDKSCTLYRALPSLLLAYSRHCKLSIISIFELPWKQRNAEKRRSHAVRTMSDYSYPILEVTSYQYDAEWQSLPCSRIPPPSVKFNILNKLHAFYLPHNHCKSLVGFWTTIHRWNVAIANMRYLGYKSIGVYRRYSWKRSDKNYGYCPVA